MVVRGSQESHLEDPTLVRVLVSDTRTAPAWLLARLYVGWHWFESGREKVSSAGWMEGGASLRDAWAQALAVPGAGGVPSGGWYRQALRFMLDHHWYGWMATAAAIGEVLVGLALLLGLLTGVAVVLGTLLSASFFVAGPAGLDPVVLLVALGLLVAWKVAGYIGLDAFVLPRLGAPWRAGLFWERIRPGSRPHGAGAAVGE